MDFDPIHFLILYAGVQALAAISPGPAFAVVSQRSLAAGRKVGLAAALGCTAGLATWLVATVVGLTVIVAKFAWLYTALKIVGGLFLLYLAYKLWQHARDPIHVPMPGLTVAETPWKAFRTGVLTQLANPKALAFCGSVLITILPPDMPLWMKAVVPVVGTAVEGAWWIFVALAFSTSRFRRGYASIKTALDRAMGATLGVLGTKLLLDA
jgi:threonine/homoserine/homoserine lactone efflux protein